MRNKSEWRDFWTNEKNDLSKTNYVYLVLVRPPLPGIHKMKWGLLIYLFFVYPRVPSQNARRDHSD